ncbi:MAG: hypothetical protein ABI151_06770, partial [Chitinophagaceae bacterium]
LFQFIVYRNTPDLAVVLGQQQFEYLKIKFRKSFEHVVIPAGATEYEQGPKESNLSRSEKIVFGYSGNIGEAHDAEFLISLAKQLDPEKHELILRLYGAKAVYVKQKIAEIPVVQFREYLSLSEIASIDVNIATLLPGWHHICVPSKAVTAICGGSALLLNSLEDADNWRMFREAAWLVKAGTEYEKELRIILQSIGRDEIDLKKSKAATLSAEITLLKKKSFQSLADFFIDAES